MEQGVDLIERRGVAIADFAHQFELRLAVHWLLKRTTGPSVTRHAAGGRALLHLTPDCFERKGVCMDALKNAGIVSVLTMLVSMAPLVAGIAFALWPSEQRLALMRPLSLAGIFSAIANVFLGLTNSLVGIASPRRGAVPGTEHVAHMLAETMAPPFVAFACLTLAWLCVAIGMRKLAQSA
jgi:hypothetical protein